MNVAKCSSVVDCQQKVVVLAATLVRPFEDGLNFWARVCSANLHDYVLCATCARKRVEAGEKNFRFEEAQKFQEKAQNEANRRRRPTLAESLRDSYNNMNMRPILQQRKPMRRGGMTRQSDTMQFGASVRPPKAMRFHAPPRRVHEESRAERKAREARERAVARYKGHSSIAQASA